MDWIARQSPFTFAAWALLLAAAVEQFAFGHPPWGWVALSGAGLPLMWVLFERYLGFAAPRSFIAGFAIFTVATLLLGEIRGFYRLYPAWDYGLHAIAGTAFAAFAALPARALRVPAEGWALGLFAFLFGTSCGVAWEVFEYAVDVTFGIDTQKGLPDTMHDLICNTAGAGVGAWIAARWARGRGVGPPGSCLDDFAAANPRWFG